MSKLKLIIVLISLSLNVLAEPVDKGLLKDDKRAAEIKLQSGSTLILEQMSKGHEQQVHELRMLCMRKKNNKLKCEALSFK